MNRPKLKIGDRVKYISVNGNRCVARVVSIDIFSFDTSIITVDGRPYKLPINTHGWDAWELAGFKILGSVVRLVDHGTHYITEPVNEREGKT